MALTGLKVVEFAGLAPGPFTGLVLADNGASVIRVDRPSSQSNDLLCRGKRSLAINPKVPSGLEALKRLITTSDVIIDPFRPGVMERLGLGPAVFLGDEKKKGINERLIYARIVGFPRTGPYKDMAGHDINYLAISGVLALLPGTSERPTFPMNILADFAGGGLMCVLGIMLALIQREKTGRGKVVNVDMVSGTRYLSTLPILLNLHSIPPYASSPRGTNLLDGGAPFYDVYTCKDGRWVTVGCLEPKFFATFLDKFLGALPGNFALHDGWKPTIGTQDDTTLWPRLREFIQKGFLTETRDYWERIFYATDACVLPVLTPLEAGALNRFPSPLPWPHPQPSGGNNTLEEPSLVEPGRDTLAILSEVGLVEQDIKNLALDGALGDDLSRISPKL